MALPHDYLERVYAGVLGKLIGVYLGRPFEGWSYERISAELGEIWYYVHDRRDVALRNHTLVVTDDDVSGTFTFLRALPDYGCPRDLTPQQIGQTWLNYIIEGRTILWWGGLGNSTEHTAFLRLKAGMPAPASGSIAVNGRTVAEQIGSQIFIDGWAMVAPGDPALAADLARRAASVSHDGEAIYGAQALAAMEAQAFVEPNIDALLDCGLAHIPAGSTIARLIGDVREWHARDGDWRTTRQRIERHYGYDTYGGNCHMVPNHALIILGLLYGAGDLQTSLMIANTAGWDTDCNAGNLGCLLGIRGGLPTIDAGPDWRGPIADRLYLPTADGGRAISDAVQESYAIVNLGRALAGEPALAPKHGARFHFELPGALQGFLAEDSIESRDTLTLENVSGHSAHGSRSLRLGYRQLAAGRVARAATATFVPPEALEMPGSYELIASPSLYPGQLVRAALAADAANDRDVRARLYLRVYGAGDALVRAYGPEAALAPGAAQAFEWRVPSTGGAPIAEIGIELAGAGGASGAVYLDLLTWEGAPDVVLGPQEDGGTLWRRAWVNALDQLHHYGSAPFRLVQNHGTGMIIQGTREWADYRVSAELAPQLAAGFGLAARVQGLARYYALMLGADGRAWLVKALDGERVLAERAYAWELEHDYALELRVEGARVQALVGGELLFDIVDGDRPLLGGAVGLICQEGNVLGGPVTVAPL